MKEISLESRMMSVSLLGLLLDRHDSLTQELSA